ncbi:hypothetical protein EJ03DRAFT_277138 [Teratosphaeria nubilosa]|uniref:F-box domain-containing protein n=1 Tax=Teratosphaeria nubilosa TaxID=161662 RepID=A0A6G1L2P8_9PEZI|nr:hypothetical protein EJ03DRAFT_277138 [Teratosphaeria nubilosa]
MQSPGVEDDEPLVDTTAPLVKRSKKTARLERQQQRRQQKAACKIHSFLELPPELAQEVLSHLLPSDVMRLTQLNHSTREFILENEGAIARDIMQRRYWVLSRCFPLPQLVSELDHESRLALEHPRRQGMIIVHTRYQHMKAPDASYVCTCNACLWAWNNLNVILDFAHFQDNLDNREPIPMIPRGTQPEWNAKLIGDHASIVERAMVSPIVHAAIMEKHLNSITSTLLRQTRFPSRVPVHRHNKTTATPKTVHPSKLNNFLEQDAILQDDQFLEREGKESLEIPFHRDNYYSLLAYVPNRKWGRDEEKWKYYIEGQHDRDLELYRRWFLHWKAVEQIADGQISANAIDTRGHRQA